MEGCNFCKVICVAQSFSLALHYVYYTELTHNVTFLCPLTHDQISYTHIQYSNLKRCDSHCSQTGTLKFL